MIFIKEEELWEDLQLGNKLILVLSGKLISSDSRYTDCHIRNKQILYLPAGSRSVYKAKEDSLFFVICIQEHTYFCDDYNFKDLDKDVPDIMENTNYTERKFSILDMNENIEKYLYNLYDYLDAGVKCKNFFHLKIKELFYIFRWTYPKETLKEFFQDDLKGSNEFASSIMNNWYKYRSVGELATAMNYSTSGFEKRFKRVFGQSPYKWMTEQKARRVFRQIKNTDLTFKQISSEFGFVSLPRFYDFCKVNFSKSPGDIRGNGKVGEKRE